MKGRVGEGAERGMGTRCGDRERRRRDHHGKLGVGHGVIVGGRFASCRNHSRRRSRLSSHKGCRHGVSGRGSDSLSCIFGWLIAGGFAVSCFLSFFVTLIWAVEVCIFV